MGVRALTMSTYYYESTGLTKSTKSTDNHYAVYHVILFHSVNLNQADNPSYSPLFNICFIFFYTYIYK